MTIQFDKRTLEYLTHFVELDRYEEWIRGIDHFDEMSCCTWEEYYKNVHFQYRCKKLYDYLQRVFKNIHMRCEKKRMCDNTKKCDFGRAFDAWMTLGCPQPIEAFIKWQYNCGLGEHDPPNLEKFENFKQSYKCLFKNKFDIVRVHQLYYTQNDDIVAIQKTLDKAIQKCQSIIQDMNGKIESHLSTEHHLPQKRAKDLL